PNVVVSSGVLTQAVFSLSGLVVGSAFVEGVFRLGGVGEVFIEGATRGQAELAGFATLVYFLVTAVGVLLAEGLVIYLDPDGGLGRERSPPGGRAGRRPTVRRPDPGRGRRPGRRRPRAVAAGRGLPGAELVRFDGRRDGVRAGDGLPRQALPARAV